MTVQELSSQHRRYVELSDRFRAAWAFHQFIGSLNKVLLDGPEPRYPVDFQSVYSALRELSGQLTAAHSAQVRERLNQLEPQLELLVKTLVLEDSKVSPASLRQFFSRVKNTNVKVLSQLAKFYVYAFDDESWTADRADKVDFLLTRISLDADGGEQVDIGSDAQIVRNLVSGLWTLVGRNLEAREVQRVRGEIAGIQREIAALESLDELNENHVVTRYRELKHGLGRSFFHPEVVTTLLETNRRLRESIRRLYHIEEQRILSEFQRVLDLERQGPADFELGLEIAEFRGEIDRFEAQLQRDELSLIDLKRLRERTRSLLARLDGRTRGVGEPAPELLAVTAPVAVPEPETLIAEPYRQLFEALEATGEDERPEAIVLRPDLFSFRLEVREVEAFRRLAGATPDPGRERFLLEAAALRVRLADQVTEIRSLLDESAVTGVAPVYTAGRRLSRLADRFVRLFDHHVEQAIEAGDATEARELYWLKMRLMRDHAGHWLLVHKPARHLAG
ncbi:MAG TPA: hypothetical protein VF017_21365 [Thermoanaerobaculia bacterium]|nr:hypothetical protein [Thermoanaerobaculia bacterium]